MSLTPVARCFSGALTIPVTTGKLSTVLCGCAPLAVDLQRVLNHALGAEALAHAGEPGGAELLPEPAILQQPDDGGGERALDPSAAPADQ